MISWMERPAPEHPPRRTARRSPGATLAAATLALALATCDEIDVPAGLVAPTAASVVIAESGLQMQVGETRTLTVEIRDADGEPIPGAPLSWRSGDARVANVDARGRVTALRAGGTHVYAESGLLRDSVSVSVFGRADVEPPS